MESLKTDPYSYENWAMIEVASHINSENMNYVINGAGEISSS